MSAITWTFFGELENVLSISMPQVPNVSPARMPVPSNSHGTDFVSRAIHGPPCSPRSVLRCAPYPWPTIPAGVVAAVLDADQGRLRPPEVPPLLGLLDRAAVAD